MESAKRPDEQAWPPDVSDRLADYVRELRFHADASQREFAGMAGVTPAMIARIESGTVTDPRLSTVARLVSAVGYRLLICDAEGVPMTPQPAEINGCRDNADRRMPAHLDAVPRGLGPLPPWWLEHLGQWTFIRDRARRDRIRELDRFDPSKIPPFDADAQDRPDGADRADRSISADHSDRP
jgi:transcriptional regulator with XRE-family HTH domain